MTYSAVYTVGDLLYGRSGITTKNSNLKNTTTFNAKFLGDRLRVNGDFTYQQKTQEKTKKQVRSPYKQAGYKTKVNPVTTEEYGVSKARRPFNSRLNKTKLVDNGFTPLPDWKDALSRYLKEIQY